MEAEEEELESGEVIHVWASPEALVRMCSRGLGSVHLLWSTASMQSPGSQGETLRGVLEGGICVYVGT